MKIKDNFIMSKIDNEYIVITIGDIEGTFNGYLKLNSTSAFLWEKLENEIDIVNLIEDYKDAFKVSLKCAKEDISTLIETLKSINALDGV